MTADQAQIEPDRCCDFCGSRLYDEHGKRIHIYPCEASIRRVQEFLDKYPHLR